MSTRSQSTNRTKRQLSGSLSQADGFGEVEDPVATERTGGESENDGHIEGDGKGQVSGASLPSLVCLYCKFWQMSYCVCCEPAKDDADLRKKLIARRLTAEGNYRVNPFMFKSEQAVIERIDQAL